MQDGAFSGEARERKGNKELNQSNGRTIVTANAEVGVLWSPRDREQEREVQVVLVEAMMWALKLEKQVHETLNLPEGKQEHGSLRDTKGNTSLYKQTQEILLLRWFLLLIFESPLIVK